jgi:hypothetical protein
MTTHTLFPFCRRSHRRIRFGSKISLLFLPCSFLSRLLPRPSPSAFLIPQQSGIPLQAGLQAHRPTIEGKPQGTPTLPFLKCGRVLPFSTSALHHTRRSSNSLTLRFVTSPDGHWMLGDCQTLRQCRESYRISRFEACQGMPQCVYPKSHV